MSTTIRSARQRGFTLVEFLVVIALIGILITLLLSAVQAARETARRMTCGNNFRQLGLAAHQHHDQHRRLPPGVGFTPFADSGVWGQHFFHLLPFLEQGNLYERARGSAAIPPPNGPITIYFPGNDNVYSERVQSFLCPSDSSAPGGVVTVNALTFGASCFAANSQAFAPVPGVPQSKARLADITDGTSSTIFYAEKYAHCTSTSLSLDGGNFWAYCASKGIDLPPPMEPPFKPYHASFAIAGYFGNPNTIGPESRFQSQPKRDNCDPTLASTAHASGMQVCLADASVRTLSPTMSGATWWAAVTAAGGELPGSDW